jgi:molecular chaperone DnaJ
MFFCIKQISRQITQAKLKQYYTILGVTPKSTEQDIKKQFRKLAKEYHPDTGNQKSEHKFKEVLEAYKYLSDPKNPKTLTESSFSSGPSTHS